LDDVIATNNSPPAREIYDAQAAPDYCFASRHGGCPRIKLWKWFPGTNRIILLHLFAEHVVATWDPRCTSYLGYGGNIFSFEPLAKLSNVRGKYTTAVSVTSSIVLLCGCHGIGVMEYNNILFEYKFKKELSSWLTPKVCIGHNSGKVIVAFLGEIMEMKMFDIENVPAMRLEQCKAFYDVRIKT
jgi:hypothetical protein